MKYTFDSSNLQGLSLSEFFLLCFFDTPLVDYQAELGFLQSNDFIDNNHRLTESGREVLKTVLSNTKDDRIDNLAKELAEIYPVGTKPGTAYRWKSNPKEVKDKLKRFFIVYKEEDFTDEEIISATKNYVQRMEYSPYMRLLKYFILKNNSDKDKESDLCSEILLLREGCGEQQQDEGIV